MNTFTIKSFKHSKRKFIHFKRNFAKQAPLLKVIGCLLLPLAVLLLPLPWLRLDTLDALQHRTVALFALAVIFWVLEPIPIYATSILIIFLELVMLSDSAFNLFAVDPTSASLLSYKEILGTFASPIIILFLGGFFLAIAATKYQLDRTMAKMFIKPFGTSPKWVMLGLMVITALFSMFMSNTATTAMMLSILMPVMTSLDKEDKGRTAFALSIPVAANIGGIGTPIGSPPNAIAMKYLGSEYGVTFSKWMVLGVPYVIIMILVAWLLLRYVFPSSTRQLRMDMAPQKAATTRRFPAIVIYLTFGVTVLLWLTDFIHGMNSYVVAMLPVAVFLCFGILDKDDFKFINWDVLWLVSGGIALGLALDRTGLAQVIVEGLPFQGQSPYFIFGGAALIGMLSANFMSHTATANLLLPIIAVLATSITGLEAYGGPKILLLSTTLCLSLGMALPISTPPNALAYSTGLISTTNMSRIGILVGIIGLTMVFVVIFLEKQLGLI